MLCPVGQPPISLIRSNSSRGWGGMDAGDGMLYPAQVVDGLVHQLGGRALREQLQAVRAERVWGQPPDVGRRDEAGQLIRCPEGSAVVTSGAGSLGFELIAHTAPPFWGGASLARGGGGAAITQRRQCHSSPSALATQVACGSGP
jgi:hypothetical protein